MSIVNTKSIEHATRSTPTMKNYFALPSILFQLFVGMLFFSQSIMAQGSLQLELEADTLFVCANEPVTLRPTASGGNAPYMFSWSDGSNQQELTIISQPGDSTWFGVEVTDTQGQAARDSILVIAFANCIWPGDMNGDGIANHVDVLEWGRAAGTNGPIRPRAHTNWIGQASPNWGHTLPGGHDYAYADADGDGIVHVNDLQAIDQNYVQVRPLPGSGVGNGPELQFVFPSDSTLAVGDTIRIPVLLGTANQPVDSMYGLAVSIGYDNSIINAGSVSVEYDSSWLGDVQTDLVGKDWDFHQSGQIDIAVTRINQRTRSGYGKLFDIIVTIDNVAGKNNSVFTLTIDALDAQLIKGNGEFSPLTSRSLSLEILPEPSPREPVPGSAKLKVYPNPTTSLLIIDPGPHVLQEVQLINMQGKQLWKEEKEWENTFSSRLTAINKGMYFLRMKTKEGVWLTEKIQIID